MRDRLVVLEPFIGFGDGLTLGIAEGVAVLVGRNHDSPCLQYRPATFPGPGSSARAAGGNPTSTCNEIGLQLLGGLIELLEQQREIDLAH